ncbi:endo-1,4-beta-xylanase [Rhodopirellula europaea]|jgi:endo-1,4-beta-xylanase|uniref:endo-1,4-beta-xylanase n=1 Tax=Rhodopirellula europaea SH398 TaxID=1263868 RepID=M5S0P8_9BACT|nr:endo-1,4-beta-xylanase [Rhodopirellula europaea]EMI25130.1 glycoside hydrolase family 10 [Rhodopirellula europaea SH398]
MRRWLASLAIALLLSSLGAPATLIHAFAQESQTPAEGTTLVPTAEFRLDARPGTGSIDRQNNLITVNCPAPQEEAWALQVQCEPISNSVSTSDVFCVSFDARAIASSTDGLGSIHVSMATNDPWEPIEEPNGFRTFDVPNQWHPFRICFRAKQNYDANRVYASIQCAEKKQRLEIRDLKLIGLGNVPDASLPFTRLFYPGADNDAWRAEAQRSIDRHRKRNLTIRVVDAAGQPLAGATVQVQQQKHDYAFGAFVGNTPIHAGENAAKFREQTKRWFNRVTLPRYWADWGTDRPAGVVKADATAEWAIDAGFELKNHLLLYPQFIPDRVKQLADQPARFQTEIETAMDAALERTRDMPIAVWDAINELRDVSLVGDVLGRDYYADVFNRGQRSQPNARWFINEYGLMTGGSERSKHLATYIQQIEQILDSGGTVEGIGVQGHFQADLITMPEAWKVLNELSRFQLPIEITEFDVDTRDEATQAQFTRDFLTLVFAHPATTGFTTWGFWEGDMWRPHGAMIREDWTIKPNGQVWEELILNTWWTNQTVQTDAEGIATVRAFRGTHRVQAEAQDWARIRTVNLLEDETITLQIGVGGE